MGKSIAGSLEKVLESSSKNDSEENKTPVISATELKNPEEYIFLPGKKYNDFMYDDCCVSMHRLGATPEVSAAAQTLGLQVSNTARENNGKEYIGNINWFQAMSLTASLGGYVLDLRQFADFLLLLKSGDAVDGNGKKIPATQLKEIFNEITEVRNPNRAEWLDADFKVKGKELYIHYNHRTVSGTLTPQNKELLTDYLTENKTPGIYMHDWLQTANNHGLPKSTIAEGNLYYWAPMKDNKSVARFDADSVGVGLFCDRDPGYSGGSLGLFASISASQNENK